MSARAWDRRRIKKRWSIEIKNALKQIDAGADYVMLRSGACMMSWSHYQKVMRLVDAIEKHLDSLPAE